MRVALAVGVLLALFGCASAFGPSLLLLRSKNGGSMRERICYSRPVMSERGDKDQVEREEVRGETVRISRRIIGAAFASGAAFVTGQSASAFKWATVEQIAQDPSILAKAIDPAVVEKVTTKWREQVGVAAVNAADYTVEYDEFVKAVRKAGKAKIQGEVVENPSDEQLLSAWKVEEKRRADLRAKEGKEPLTRPVKVLREGTKDQYDIKYKPPVVTNASVPEALKLGQYLKEIGATMYGAYWCTHCYDQKMQLGYEAVEQYLDYVECDKKGADGKRDFCKSRKVSGFPTWEVRGELYPGQLSLEGLAELVGFDLKTGKPSGKVSKRKPGTLPEADDQDKKS